LPRLLSQTGDRLSAAEQADHLFSLGKAQPWPAQRGGRRRVPDEGAGIGARSCGCPGGAGRGQRPDRGSRSGQCDCSHRAASPVLAGNLSPDERFGISCRVGRLQREELQDPRAALETFLAGLHLAARRPGCPARAGGDPHPQWPLVARRPALEGLVRVSFGEDKARYLVATANILNYELESPLESSRTVQPGAGRESNDQRSFERIQRILSSRQDWRGLARAYRRMIKRLGAVLCRTSGLGCWACGKPWPTFACAACTTSRPRRPRMKCACRLAPEDLQHQESLARAYEAQGSTMFRAGGENARAPARPFAPMPTRPRSTSGLWPICTAGSASMIACFARVAASAS